MGEEPRGQPNSDRALLLAGVILAAINLRPVMIAIGPLIGEIQADTGLDAAGAGLIAALPVLCFGIFSGVVPLFGRRFGLEEVLLVAMLALAAGILLRLPPGIPLLLLGTAVLGTAIAFTNVLLPGVTKRSFPLQGRRISAMYVAVLGISATIASAIAIPLSETWLGWRGALALWAFPALVAAAAPFPPGTSQRRRPAGTAAIPARGRRDAVHGGPGIRFLGRADLADRDPDLDRDREGGRRPHLRDFARPRGGPDRRAFGLR